MEKRVEIKKSISECRICSDTAEQYNAMPPCKDCRGKTGRWVDTVSGFLGTYAVVCMDNGSVAEVPLDRLKVIKENNESEVGIGCS